MQFKNKNDYKVSQKVKILDGKEFIGVEYIYLVPMNKNYNSIKSDYNERYNSDSKETVAFAELGNRSYNGYVKIYEDGTFSQYRDGSFFEFVGRIAL